jgi:hypothetical protein
MKLNDILKYFSSLNTEQQCYWIINSLWDEETIEELIERKYDNDTKDILKLLSICKVLIDSKEKFEPLQFDKIYTLWISEIRNNKLNQLL